MAFLQPDVLVERLMAEIERIANTPCPLAQREQRIAKLEEEIDRMQRTEEAIVVATGAPGLLDLGVNVAEISTQPSAHAVGFSLAALLDGRRGLLPPLHPIERRARTSRLSVRGTKKPPALPTRRFILPARLANSSDPQAAFCWSPGAWLAEGGQVYQLSRAEGGAARGC